MVAALNEMRGIGYVEEDLKPKNLEKKKSTQKKKPTEDEEENDEKAFEDNSYKITACVEEVEASEGKWEE
jgi:hypothetical protein